MTQQWQGFAALNLSGVDEEQGGRTLQEGDHICRISSAKLEKTANGQGIKLTVQLDGPNGAYVRDVMNICNKSEQAQEIGRKRLKHLLIQAGHPNPNQPGDVQTMVGLFVGVHVVKGEDWTDQNGQRRNGGGEPRSMSPYYKAEGQMAPASAPRSVDSFDDPIPF